jgi:hypothetical protein
VIKIARKRKITQKDREIFHQNALKGTKKWIRTPTGARRAERNRRAHGWGFEGKSPRTRKRTYKIKR